MNPADYLTPEPDFVKLAYLQSIARRQRGVQFCIAVYFAGVLGSFMLPPELRPLLGFVVLPCVLVGLVFAMLLAVRLNGVVLGSLLCLLMLVPLLGLLILFLIDRKATETLRKHGVPVGLFGARGPITAQTTQATSLPDPTAAPPPMQRPI